MSSRRQWSRRAPLATIVAAALVALVGCDRNAPSGARASSPEPVVESEASPTPIIDTLATGLETPWGVAIAPDGRIFVTERPGRLRVIVPDSGLRAAPLLSLDVHAHDPEWHPESGLMGIALAPDFATTGHAFLLATFRRDPAPARPSFVRRALGRVGLSRASPDALPFEDRVLRVTIGADSATDLRVVVRGLPTNHYHAGGAIAFGPDGKLYVTVGDGRAPRLVRDPQVPMGKVLRYEPDGRIPADNPVAGSAMWASGLRNTQALVWATDGTLFGVDHGPSGLPDEGGRAGRDELNVISRGSDHGWPIAAGWEGNDGFAAPLRVWGEAVAPAGLAFAPHAREPWRDRLFVARLRGGVERLTLARGDSSWRVASSEVIALAPLRRIRTLVAMEDGALLATTSNRGVRGIAQSHDDLVVRIRLP